MPLLPGLLLLLLFLAGPLPGGAQEPEAACGPDGCYAVYFQRRSFLDAWRSCRELGGNLATVKHHDEAAQVAELLRGTAGSRPEQSPRLFWIGLQRQPRQCFPLRPLRGFMWITGEQDTFYTNWARPAVEAGGGSCAAPRCVVLDDQQGQWLEGSCTVPVDGYLCRFAFQGMCPGLDEEGGPVAYTTPFGPAGRSLRYVPFGTVAAVTCGGAVPAVSVLCLQKDDGTVGWSKEAPLCREHGYQHSWCEGDNGGCQQLCLDEGPGYSCECHSGYLLMPDGHSCAPSDACRDQPCQFECLPDEEGGYHCQCPEGYELSSDDHHCEDLDECADAPCEHQCENTDGSYLCRCHLGFSPSEDEPGHCTDTDECQIPGVCQQMCVNYVGGFECYCTEGYDLEPDGISCSPVGHPPLLATAQSHRGGDGFLQHFGDRHGWPREIDDLAEHGLALTDHFPVFPDFEGVFPRDASLPPPEPSTAPWASSSLPLGQEPASLPDRSSPASSPPRSPHPTKRVARQDSPSDPPPTELPSLWLAPTASAPGPPPAPGDAVMGGVRALLPASAAPSPAPGEGGLPRRRRDDRWLLVALLVPMCVFLVIMLALGIVYCTRCGAQAKSRSITQCYRWVSSSGGSSAAKGAASPASRPGQPATCRTSV
ncbi:endosialin [Heteronotia binoei]|uniref:endosialin n=1 Tax=Heteronotia binoei TaxID=13085 RepID=UPI0029302056|nr:endosialin [Heteronotia binoei]